MTKVSLLNKIKEENNKLKEEANGLKKKISNYENIEYKIKSKGLKLDDKSVYDFIMEVQNENEKIKTALCDATNEVKKIFRTNLYSEFEYLYIEIDSEITSKTILGYFDVYFFKFVKYNEVNYF